jgi:hypothetical protein
MKRLITAMLGQRASVRLKGACGSALPLVIDNVEERDNSRAVISLSLLQMASSDSEAAHACLRLAYDTRKQPHANKTIRINNKAPRPGTTDASKCP